MNIEISQDGDEVYTDMTTVNSLLACNKELLKRIKALPSAEAEEYDDYEHATLVDIKEPLKVEVVQCKDCEHWDTADGECYGLDGVHYSKADDFCSHGERKEP